MTPSVIVFVEHASGCEADQLRHSQSTMFHRISIMLQE